MTGDNIIRMAREAGWTSYDSQDERFERFAELVRAEEREVCAKVCEENSRLFADSGPIGVCIANAASIRKRNRT